MPRNGHREFSIYACVYVHTYIHTYVHTFICTYAASLLTATVFPAENKGGESGVTLCAAVIYTCNNIVHVHMYALAVTVNIVTFLPFDTV